MSTTVLIKCSIVLLLSSFMIFTVVSFLQFRLKKRQADFERILEIMGVADNAAKLAYRSMKDEYDKKDYFLPVAFATLISVFGFGSLLLGQELISINENKPNLLLTEILYIPGAELQVIREQSMLVLSLAFFGAFIWSAQNIARRLIAGDLLPGTYYNAALRMIFAMILAMMLVSFLNSTPAGSYTSDVIPVIAFLTGMLPEQVLVYLKERISIFSRRRKGVSDELPLDMIEGMNMFHRVRLGEVAIDNAQNLAQANVVELLLKTSFNPVQLIDWIAQAKLYLVFKDNIGKMRSVGIRTVFDYKYVCEEESNLEALEKETGISKLTLKLANELLNQDSAVINLEQFSHRLNPIAQNENTSVKAVRTIGVVQG